MNAWWPPPSWSTSILVCETEWLTGCPVSGWKRPHRTVRYAATRCEILRNILTA